MKFSSTKRTVAIKDSIFSKFGIVDLDEETILESNIYSELPNLYPGYYTP